MESKGMEVSQQGLHLMAADIHRYGIDGAAVLAYLMAGGTADPQQRQKLSASQIVRQCGLKRGRYQRACERLVKDGVLQFRRTYQGTNFDIAIHRILADRQAFAQKQPTPNA